MDKKGMSTPLNSLKALADSAPKLSKNPLGIIALFIVFIYAFASLVVGFSSQLEAGQKTPLIWFLVIFPILVLGVFAWFVTCHHSKLYAPSDFRDDEGFIRSMSPQEHVEKILKDVASVQRVTINSNFGQTEISSTPSSMLGRAEQEALPPPAATLVMNVVRSEEMVMKELRNKYGRSCVLRNLRIDLPGGRVGELDGALLLNGEFVAVEIKYVNAAAPVAQFVQPILDRMERIGNGIIESKNYARFGFMLVLVMDFDVLLQKQFADDVAKALKHFRFRHYIEKYDFKSLSIECELQAAS